MIKFSRHIITLVAILVLFSAASFAQTGSDSETADNASVSVAPGTVELRFSETTYFGPNSQWEIHGTLEIWSKNIWIAPSATFTGTGRIIIHDPSTNPYYGDIDAGPTRIDGNGAAFLDVDIELRNPANLVLADLEDPGYGTANGSGAAAAALNIGKRFTFAIDGGDILLNGHDLGVGPEGGFEDYNSNRMVVTGNSTVGHVVKHYGNTQPFVFPVGIAEGDYTPATLSPAATATLYVSVQDYLAADIDLSEAERGMDRIWHIFADEGVSTTYTLQHNTITNGSAYMDADAQIVQYAGSGNWLGDVTTLEAAGVHTRADILTVTGVTDEGSWFTKLTEKEDVGPEANNGVATVVSGESTQINVLENALPGSSPIVVGSVRVVRQPSNGTVEVNADGSITYTPNPGFVGEDSFEFEIADENGLVSSAKITITVTPKPLRIPNVFTPNGDGQNDVFEIEGIEAFDRIEVIVVNRWGNEVYRNDNYKNDWNGGDLNEGTYYYRLTTHKGSERAQYTGWLLIKRQ
ncbi:gliding motility-associated C-terminal domain-containing protein [Parapedobacter indicus]|uniref:Gliding motility-associated C-terminal domain-containing protein n=1 Tax=Parapedobacter indicus TaxID=1477437 RepID=A0A1I3NSX0_9SPHI|nr:gliding motility-associated C-terminal domain-containing protein [Parapedobacter indicus]PPL01079.1 gliding motility-associated-like protein [Parapedobacter indicus]SFJ12299.1 gliding motility-associated C-terminal domain-containing protein [Parapedobacter indicus]